MPLHCQKRKRKEIQKKRNIKSRKIDKRKRKILVLMRIITTLAPRLHPDHLFPGCQTSDTLQEVDVISSIINCKDNWRETLGPSSVRGQTQWGRSTMLAWAHSGLFSLRCAWVCWGEDALFTPFCRLVRIPAISTLNYFLSLLGRWAPGQWYMGACLRRWGGRRRIGLI